MYKTYSACVHEEVLENTYIVHTRIPYITFIYITSALSYYMALYAVTEGFSKWSRTRLKKKKSNNTEIICIA